MNKTILVELSIFVICSILLLLGAKYSESFVPTSFEQETFKPSVIEPRDNMYGVAKADDELIWIVGNFGKIVFSGDGGNHWESLDSGVIKNLQDVAAWDKDRLVAVGNEGVVIISTDGGINWQKIDAPKSEVDNKLVRVKTYPGGKAWACGMMGAALFTTDYGKTWHRGLPEQDIAFNDVAFANPEIGVIVCEFGRILRTADGGKSWKEINTPIESSLTAVSFDPSGNGVAVGLGGIVLLTSDQGETWSHVPKIEATEHFWDIIYAGQQWFAVGNKGIFARSKTGLDWDVSQLSDKEMLWHTEVLAIDTKLFVVGGSQGIYENGRWSYLF